MKNESIATDPLTDFFSQCKTRVESSLRRVLQDGNPDSRLGQAMEYATLKGGKRLRPVLAYAAALATGDDMSSADNAACAVELMHCYSLVHDDLPAMDNDDLRRGIPTVHKAFDDATAVLTGDALLTLSLRVVAGTDEDHLPPATRLAMVTLLADAAGFKGMVAGQAIDFEATGKMLDVPGLEAMHGLKTGALINASVELGALSSRYRQPQQLTALKAYARCIGLAFQVQDDILDVTTDTVTLGKPQGADHLLNKPTYVSLLGLEPARQKARQLSDAAIATLEDMPASADLLRLLATYVVQRTH